ncbi:MAG: hypothetical protein LBJ73_03510 [Rickettsiales bacterium]|nr:hypothetical protein [Rickettsiales bacterium]
MAKKPVKKTIAKKAPAAKPVVKPAVKKAPVKKIAAKKTAPVKTAPIAAEKTATTAPIAASCAQGCECGCGDGKKCHCGGAGRFVKKLIIFAIIFALGFAAAKFCTMRHHHGFKGFHGPRVEFVNGCVDVTKISCPETAEKIAAADANGDGCVTKEELKSARKELGKGCGCGKCGGHPKHQEAND